MSRYVNGVWIADVGDVATWDGAKYVPAPPRLLPGPRGPGGGMGMQGPAGPAGLGTTIVTPFRMRAVPTATTLSLVFVDLIPPTPVTVLAAGDILLDFDASIVLTPPPGSTSFDGANFQFLWDGAPLGDNAFFELDPGNAGTGFDTFGLGVRFRSLIVNPALGAHTLSVQWSVNVAGDQADAFVGSGNLTIQTAPV